MIAEELIETCANDRSPFSMLSEDAQWFVLEVAYAYGLYEDFQNLNSVDQDVYSYAIYHAVEMGVWLTLNPPSYWLFARLVSQPSNNHE